MERATRLSRSAGGRLPFVPYGLVPVAGLVLLLIVGLAPFAFDEIQNRTHQAVGQALKAAGTNWVTWRTSGQWVVLEGEPPSRPAADAALAAARGATVDTLFGPARPATWVTDHFTWKEAPLVPPVINQPRIGETRPEPAPAEPAPPTAATPTSSVIACNEAMKGLLQNARIEFASGSAEIEAESSGLLDLLARAVQACPGTMRIEGYTDNVGPNDRNWILSRNRAEAVRFALVRRGANAERLVAEGFGEADPIASNRTQTGRARNRRIEIHPAPSPS